MNKDNPVAVRLGSVEVHVDFEPSENPQESVNVAESLAVEMVMHLRSWFRTQSPWIGLTDEMPEELVPGIVVDLETEEWRTDLTVRGVPLYAIIPEKVFDGEQVQEIIERFERLEGRDPADSFLADARYLAHSQHVPVAKQSVLLAAIACELKVKSILAELAFGQGKAMMELLLKKHREFPVSAIDFYGDVAKAIMGTSLKDENKALFGQVRDLFEKRNKIAHAHYSPTREEAGDFTRAAMKAFEWLESKKKAMTPSA